MKYKQTKMVIEKIKSLKHEIQIQAQNDSVVDKLIDNLDLDDYENAINVLIDTYTMYLNDCFKEAAGMLK